MFYLIYVFHHIYFIISLFANSLYTNFLNKTIKIHQEDAFEWLGKNQRKFDVIIVDLFTGDTPPLTLAGEDTVARLSDTLRQDGYVYVNFFRNKDIAAPFPFPISGVASHFLTCCKKKILPIGRK